jgi:hypothetical protein
MFYLSATISGNHLATKGQAGITGWALVKNGKKWYV